MTSPLTFEQIQERLNYIIFTHKTGFRKALRLYSRKNRKKFSKQAKNYINRTYNRIRKPEEKKNTKYHLKIDYTKANLNFEAWVVGEKGKMEKFKEQAKKFLKETKLINYGHDKPSEEETELPIGETYFYCKKFPKLESKWKEMITL